MFSSSRQWSIASILQWGILGLVGLQSCLLLGSFLVGGVLTSSRDYAGQVFAEKVSNRLLTLQNDMSNRWSRLDATAVALAGLPFADNPETASPEEMRQFWNQACTQLLQLMRTAGVTDGFIILTGSKVSASGTSTHKALYLRKTDPLQDDSDTTIMVGSPHLSLDQGIYFSPFWTPDLTLTPESRALYDKPLSLATNDIKPSSMGYWGAPASIVENSGKALTYSQPLTDKKGVVRGVLGVGVVESYFDMLLPSHELSADGLGYLLAVRRQNSSNLYPLVFGRPGQQELFPLDRPIRLTALSPAQNIFRLTPELESDEIPDIAACILPLDTYAVQTPFADDAWQLVGLVNEDSLYAFPEQLQKTLGLSMVVSLLLGGVLAVLYSRHITSPIVRLAHSVENSGQLSSFPRTGMAEIDRLTTAMENSNRNMANTTARILRIVDMANVPMGAFELKHNLSQVFATERLRHLLLLDEKQAAALYSDERAFMAHLRGIMANPEPEEEAVYKIAEDPEHWIKIHLASENSDVLGLVSDVTDDMLKKRRIRHERDYDALTGLCSRTFFRRQVATLMDLSYMLDMAAMIMLDLDKFKNINDTFGHQCGDDYLNALATHMGIFAGLHSIVGRRSGDEFFVFAFRLEGREALRATIRSFYESLNSAPFIFPNGTAAPIRVSIGVAWFNGSTNYEDLLRAADAALYEAKETAPGTMIEYKR